VEVRVVAGDHMALIDPAEPPWRLVRDWLVPPHSERRAGIPWDP
jgi:hypothetical protein